MGGAGSVVKPLVSSQHASVHSSLTPALHTLVLAVRLVLCSFQGSCLRIALSIVCHSGALRLQLPQAGRLAGAHATGCSQAGKEDTAADEARLSGRMTLPVALCRCPAHMTANCFC